MKIQYKKFPIVLLVLALVLAACAGQSVQQTRAPVADTPAAALPEPTATEAAAAPDAPYPVPTSGAEAAPGTAAPEASPTAAGAVVPETGGLVTYVIVPGESTVQYEVGETFLDDNRFNTAIGVTGVINGEIQLDTANPQNSSLGTITADISQFKSDSGRRDNAIRDRFIQTAQFPIVTFTPTSIEGLPTTYTPGEEITFQVTGDVMIRETTRPATFDVTARLDGDTLTGTANTTFLMSDFGFGPIQIAGMLGTEDEVKITVNYVARPK
jgi:polyisoprenoid-binding protein YceI